MVEVALGGEAHHCICEVRGERGAHDDGDDDGHGDDDDGDGDMMVMES